MTNHLKEQIVKRQVAWAYGNQTLFKFYRNRPIVIVNGASRFIIILRYAF